MTEPPVHPGRLAALQSIRSTVSAATGSAQWPGLLAGLLADVDANAQESAQVCADLAWHARGHGISALLLLRAEQITRPGPAPVAARAYRHLYLSTLRYDFRCATIETLIQNMPNSLRNRLDCYSRALYVFALLGQSRTDGLDAMQRVLNDAGDDPKILHVLLHGLWLGHLLPGRADHMLRLLTRRPLAHSSDPIARFREAAALRGLGRYREALDAIDRALELLPPGDVAVHADLVRERALITAAYDWRRLTHPLAGDLPQTGTNVQPATTTASPRAPAPPPPR